MALGAKWQYISEVISALLSHSAEAVGNSQTVNTGPLLLGLSMGRELTNCSSSRKSLILLCLTSNFLCGYSQEILNMVFNTSADK